MLKMYNKIGLVFFVVTIGVSSGRKSPDYITPCQQITPECLKKAVEDILPKMAKGVPELNMPAFDPLSLNFDLGIPGGLKLYIDDGKVTGLRNCIVKDAIIENLVVEANLHCNITVRGNYRATGRILIISLNGEGETKIKTTNLHLKAVLHLKDIVKDGITYRTISSYKVSESYRDTSRVSFVFTNLFKGNPTISAALLKFMNDNWKAVTEEFGTPILDAIVHEVVGIVKIFFSSVPKEELFFD